MSDRPAVSDQSRASGSLRPPPQQPLRRTDSKEREERRLVHGAQSEVHVAFYHAGRWSPTSAAVRWLEVGEGAEIGAAVVCPLPPERPSRGVGVTVANDADVKPVGVQTMQATQKKKKTTTKEEEEEEPRERKREPEPKPEPEEEEWHPWRRRALSDDNRGRRRLSADKGGGGGSTTFGALALLLRLDRPGRFPASAVKRSFDGGRSWGPLEFRQPGAAAAVGGGSCAALVAETPGGDADAFPGESFAPLGDHGGVGLVTRAASVGVVVPTNAPGEMMCVAQDARCAPRVDPAGPSLPDFPPPAHTRAPNPLLLPFSASLPTAPFRCRFDAGCPIRVALPSLCSPLEF